MITVSNLKKNYGTQRAVNDISFTVNSGEIVGFLGPNGAGKSTTMKIITGYLEADGGFAEVCGIRVNPNSSVTKKKIGYLPEINPLYPDMYVREYLEFLAGVHHVQHQHQKISETIKTVGLTPESNKKIGQLSKGYKQRVGLAGALIHDPEVLILDEPTSGLDPNQITEIREVIRQLGKTRTVLFSSHILQEVEAVCDKVVIIHKGNIVADDRLSNLQQSNRTTHILLIEFKEAVDNVLFADLEGVISKSQLKPGYWKLQTSDPEGLRKQLLQLSLKNNLNIVSLQTESTSLEDVFRNLTNIP